MGKALDRAKLRARISKIKTARARLARKRPPTRVEFEELKALVESRANR